MEKQKKVSPANIQKIENLIREMGYVQKMGLRVLNKEKIPADRSCDQLS